MDNVPFYAWECVTIVIPGREIDIVIKNEACMTLFLKFLVYSMKTVDGGKDSAVNIYKALRIQEEKKFCKIHKIKKISE